MLSDKLSLPNQDRALPGRKEPMPLENVHYVNGRPLRAPFSDDDSDFEHVLLGLGCFWGAERKFWQMDGVYTTAVGYTGGLTPNPTYEEVCSGLTGHNEVVMVVYDPTKISFRALISAFFELHNPTQGMRQGNDTGTQYRSGIYYSSDSQREQAERVMQAYQAALTEQNHDQITTELMAEPIFYYAEQYHQQYLAKNPNGYCGIGGTGVTCPV